MKIRTFMRAAALAPAMQSETHAGFKRSPSEHKKTRGFKPVDT
jgi:hypothetical protein